MWDMGCRMSKREEGEQKLINCLENQGGEWAMLNLQKLTIDISVEELRKASSGSPICMRMYSALNMDVKSTGPTVNPHIS